MLLFRIGFGILFIVVPLASVISRRALVALAPIGAVVLIFSALLMQPPPQPREKLKEAALSLPGLAAVVILIWAALSLLWTPYPAAGAERLARLAGSAVLAVGAISVLPERMRGSNLYLLSIGSGAAALAAIARAVIGTDADDIATLERAAVLISLLAWPAITWLSMKRRSLPAMLIAGVVGALALVLQGPLILPALLAGAVVLGGAINNLRGTALTFIVAIVLLIVCAPLVALLLSLLTPQETAFGRTMQIWSDIIIADPSRLITGHGIETALRNRLQNGLDPSAPKSLMFEVWYELGVIGALATAAGLGLVARAITQMERPIAPFALGCFAFVCTLAVTGLGTSQTWFLTATASTCIAFAAVQHGHWRTDRPLAYRRTSDRVKT